jgi:hypothetical protein
VTQDLFMRGGTLPAHASSRRHKAPAAVLLARGSASSKVAGDVTVVLHSTRAGRSKLKGAHTIHAVLVTTLKSAAGAVLTLEHRSITLHH